MESAQLKTLGQAIGLLHDFISNHGAKAEWYEVLENAEQILNESKGE
jgi:hypothetical protein